MPLPSNLAIVIMVQSEFDKTDGIDDTSVRVLPTEGCVRRRRA
jgi:hypothetical protein